MGEITINWNMIIDAAIFSIVGVLIFLLTVFLYDKLTPFNLWKELVEKQNMALAIKLGAVIIGLSIIIASAHG